VFHAGGVTRGARNVALPLLRRTPAPRGLAKDVAVSAAMWTGSHGMRSTVNVSPVLRRAQRWHSTSHALVSHPPSGEDRAFSIRLKGVKRPQSCLDSTENVAVGLPLAVMLALSLLSPEARGATNPFCGSKLCRHGGCVQCR
jgi:hypothetical protein